MSPRGRGRESDMDSGDGVPWRADRAKGGLTGAGMDSAVWSSGPPLGTLGGGFGSPHARLQGWAGGPMGWPPPPSVSSGGPWRGAWLPVPTQLSWGGQARRGTQMLALWARDVPTGTSRALVSTHGVWVAERGHKTWGASGRPCQGTACPPYPRVRRLLGQACPAGHAAGPSRCLLASRRVRDWEGPPSVYGPEASKTLTGWEAVCIGLAQSSQ